MSVVAQVERGLGELRLKRAEGTRTSVMTHVAWAPPHGRPRRVRTLAGLEELHPSRTILLFPDPKRPDGIDVRVDLKCFTVEGTSHEVCSDVIELRLGGKRTRVPGSIVQPLLITDLPTFCRWRGLPPWGEPELEQLVDVCDRLVVDSSEWRGLPGAYEELAKHFDRIAVSDIAWGRAVGWRGRLAAEWPEIKKMTKLSVTGPKADALLLAGWLRSRSAQGGAAVAPCSEELEAVAIDGEPVAPPRGGPPNPSDLLSAELDQFGRDRIYEAAVSAAR
jgi:hypothetical protein